MNCENRIWGDEANDSVANESEQGRGGQGSACKGIRLVKKGSAEVALGLVEIDKAKKAVCDAICEVEEALKLLKRTKADLEKAGEFEERGLKDINHGVRMIEEDLRNPRWHPPICPR